MTDDEKAVYAEAGHWVRMTNTVAWTLMQVLGPILVAAFIAALTGTAIPKCFLALGSALIAAAWFYVDFHYEKSANTARQMLIGIEAAAGFSDDRKFYTAQARGVPCVHSLNLFLMCFLVVLFVAWVLAWGKLP
ncbi:MAG: hypothetical protein WCB34_03940 [Methylovirgula sp.]